MFVPNAAPPTYKTVSTTPTTPILTLGLKRGRAAAGTLKDQARPQTTAIPMKLNAHDRCAPSAPPLVSTIGVLRKNIAPSAANPQAAEPNRRRLRQRTTRDTRNSTRTT